MLLQKLIGATVCRTVDLQAQESARNFTLQDSKVCRPLCAQGHKVVIQKVQKDPPLKRCEILSSLPDLKQATWAESCKSLIFVPFSLNTTAMVVLSIWTHNPLHLLALMRATKAETAVC